MYVSNLNTGELKHYGVIGMKWGVRRAASKAKSLEKLKKKAEAYDKKAARLSNLADYMHTWHDLKSHNVAMYKSKRFARKSEKLKKKAESVDDPSERLRLEKKAAKMNYYSYQSKIKANRLARTVPYGFKALRYATKSDRFKAKAEKARAKIAANKFYIDMMDKKMSSLSKEKIRQVEQPISEWIKESLSQKKK